MSRRKVITAAVYASLSWTLVHTASGQETTGFRGALAARYVDAMHGVSIEQAIAMALAREPDLQATRAAMDVARGMRVQAALRPNPTMTLMRQEQMRGADATSAVEVEWPLDVFRRTGRINSANREIDAAQASVVDRERLLAADVRQAYGDLVAAVRSLEINEELLATNQQLFELVSARVEQGASPALERNIADVERRRTASQQPVLTARAEEALIELKRRLGLGPREDLKVRDTLENIAHDTAATTQPADVQRVVSARSDVREADAHLRLADARIDAARREGRFDVGVVAGYMRMGFSFPQFGFAASGGVEPVRDVFHNLKVGAMITVPMGNHNQGAVAAARAERVGAERLREARALAAEAEVASMQARDEGAQRALTTYTTDVRRLARQNLEVVRETYVLGRVTLAEVLAEQRRYLEIESGYSETLKMAFDAQTALARALGEVR